LNDQNLGLERDVYGAARSEKDARATLSSAIKRDLTANSIVIADHMNYIKGFRYQMFCEAKAQRTPSCVVSFLFSLCLDSNTEQAYRYTSAHP
jgi:protein KTI12